MSFGTSLRGVQQSSTGRPVVFWQQQTMEANKRKPTKSNKFVKEQKHPLRNKPDPVPAVQKAPPRRGAPANPRRGTNPSAAQPTKYTITQADLDAILNTVGDLVSQNEELKKGQNKRSDNEPQVRGNEQGAAENILNLANARARPTYNPDTPPENNSRPRAVEPLEVPGLGFIDNDVKVAAPSSVPGLDPIDMHPSQTAVPKAHMTKAELKRLQWEQERVEADSALTKGFQSSPLQGIGARKPPSRLLEIKPSTPRAHLTKAERRRRESEEARRMPVSPGRTLTEFWSNQPRKVGPPTSADEQSPGIPRAYMSKAELKRQEWDQERADNDARDVAQKRPSYQARPRDPSRDAPATSDLSAPNRQMAPQSKAEQKRLQWERERAENAARDAMARPPVYESRPAQVHDPQSRDLPPDTPPAAAGVPKAHLTKSELKKLQWEKERAEMQGGGQKWLGSEPQTYSNQQQTPQKSDSSSFTPKQTLSKSELKRLQWQKEREELQNAEQQEFSPWGRPGAGAPIRDQDGKVLSDYNQRKEDGDVRQSQQAVIEQQRRTQVVNQAPVNLNSSQPAAIRSSFVLGGAAPDGDRFTSVKEREKRAWLDELERQMEEKRLAKEKEKEKRRQEEMHDTWADRFVAPPAPEKTAPNHQAPPEDFRISSAPQVVPTHVPGLDFDPKPPLDLNASGNASGELSHLRGQNRHVDEQTRREMEEKWRRQQEHQDAVKAQVEEHKRKKAEERERRAREELLEEQRLQAERDSLQTMYDQERLKAKEKEELQRRRVQSLKEAMDASAEQAHRERHERRMRKLQEGGHDTSHINANFEAKMTPRAAPSVMHVAPTSVPGIDITPRDVAVTSSIGHDPYQQDKVIVPTKYKGAPSQPFSDPMSPRREFGVQTDSDLNGMIQDINLSRESTTEIEFKGPFKTGNNTKKVRIKSSEQKEETKKEPKKLSQRPRWGGGTQTKKVVKQSEKDPYFEKRKQQREAQKLQRQQELLDMAERTMARAKQKSTTTLRARSKSRDRNQGQGEQGTRDQGGGRGRGGQGKGGQGDGRSRSLAGSRRGSSPPVPVLRPRSNQQSPPVPTLQQKRASSPETGRAPVSHRSRADTHRSQGQRRTPREAQENQPPLVNGYRSSSPPVPTLRQQEPDPPINSFRSNSPPIPAVKLRLENNYNIDAHAYEITKPSNLKQDSQRQKYKDNDPLAPPKPDGDFVPFIRTANILDPEMAEEPLPLSREATAVGKARKAYVHGIQPANYGIKMPNYEDRQISEGIPEMPQMPEADWKKDQDPILNPSLVTGHPTGRQDRILQQLSDLRRGLMQKQRELEVASPMMD